VVTSAHTVAYRSPDDASAGISMATSANVRSPGPSSAEVGVTVVQLDSSFCVRPSAPTKLPPWVSAAAAA